MLTLVHSPQTRSSRFIWLLEELGVPYELKRVTIRRGDGSGEIDSNNPHPHGKVPVLIHGGESIFESIAIALYLTDLHPEADMGPPVGDPLRGRYLTWLAYYAGVLEPAFVSKFMNFSPPRGTAGWVAADEAMPQVVKRLEAGPYLLGEKFSAVDTLYIDVRVVPRQSAIAGNAVVARLRQPLHRTTGVRACCREGLIDSP